MHDLDAGRIFWKEWRAQRSFWLALFGLAIVLELLTLVVLPAWEPIDPVAQLRIYQSLVIVLACCFATGSAAIAFAGEVEAKTKGLLQRLPVRPRDLVAGKLSLSLAGSYALFAALGLAGALMMMDRATLFSRVDSSDVSREIAVFWQFLLGPFAFVAVGALFSLIMSDVLLTVVLAGASTTILLAIPGIRDHLALQAAVIAVVALCDFFLARRWLYDAGAVEWTALPRITLPQLAGRPRRRVAETAAPIESARSAVAWRRAAGSLIWKEFRQAFPFCLKLLIAGLIALAIGSLIDRSEWGRGSGTTVVMLVLFAPLLPGVAAMRADRRDNAFGLLANRGVTPDGFLICKHLVWLSLSLSVFAILLLTDRAFLYTGQQSQSGSLWEFAADTAKETFDSSPPAVIGPLAVAAFHVILLYALAFLLALLLPGAIMAFFTAALLWLCVISLWVVVAMLRIPFWWTIGLFPVIWLAGAWVRTSDWLIGRNALSARVKAAAVLIVPFVGIFAAAIVYRVTEIPAVTIPPAVLDSGYVSGTSAGNNEKRSLFVDALHAVSGGPPGDRDTSEPETPSDDWKFAKPHLRAWVAENAPALKLALEAAQRKPGFFQLHSRTEEHDGGVAWNSDWQKLSWLIQLLRYSARKFESEDRLDEALLCYTALARLGSDAARSEAFSPWIVGDRYRSLALEWMQGWAAQPKQTTERIKKAIREFESLEQNVPPLSAQILREWQTNRLLLRKSIWGHSQATLKERTVSELWWIRWLFPWELVRLERLTDADYAADLKQAEAVESDLQAQGFVAMTAERVARWNRVETVPWKYWRTTLVPPEVVLIPWWGPEQYVNRLATERMDLIGLAMADETRVHHKRADSLRALVPTYFQRLPVDPWTGSDFVYEAQGLPAEIIFDGGKFTPGTPFLASGRRWSRPRPNSQLADSILSFSGPAVRLP